MWLIYPYSSVLLHWHPGNRMDCMVCQHLFLVTVVRTFIYFVIMVVQGAINIHSDAITCRRSPHYRPFRRGIWLALTLMLRHSDVSCHFPKVQHHILCITPYVLCYVLLCLDTGRFQKYVYLSRLLYLHLGHLTLKNPCSTWYNHNHLTTKTLYNFNGQTIFRQERGKCCGFPDIQRMSKPRNTFAVAAL